MRCEKKSILFVFHFGIKTRFGKVFQSTAAERGGPKRREGTAALEAESTLLMRAGFETGREVAWRLAVRRDTALSMHAHTSR